MEQRPPLDKHISIDSFKAFYWLKKELTDFCRTEGLSPQGGKIAIAQRIERYLKTGEKKVPSNCDPSFPKIELLPNLIGPKKS